MSDTSSAAARFEEWAATISASVEETTTAWHDLARLGLATMEESSVTVSPLAMRRAVSDAQRRLAGRLSGYLLTENSFIVRRKGAQTGLPCILNTRIAVEQIAGYFKDGWGVTEIEHDLPILKREEIEAAI